MEIRYRNKQLRELCEMRAAAERKLGAACASKLGIRLLALEAALRMGDLIAGWPHPLKGDRAGQFALELVGGIRLVFSAAGEPCPTLAGGAIDWPNVTAVCVEFIGNYHG